MCHPNTSFVWYKGGNLQILLFSSNVHFTISQVPVTSLNFSELIMFYVLGANWFFFPLFFFKNLCNIITWNVHIGAC